MSVDGAEGESLNTTTERLTNSILANLKNIVQEKVEHYVGAAANPSAFDGYDISAAAVGASCGPGIAKMLVKALCQTPTSAGAYLPYQDRLSADLKDAIDTGKINLVELANMQNLPDGVSVSPSIKATDASILEGDVLSRHAIPDSLITCSSRNYISNYLNVDKWNTKGDASRGIPSGMLWNGTSPPFAYAPQDGQAAFNLIACILALRMSGYSKKPPVDEYMQCEHEQNNVGLEGKAILDRCGRGVQMLKRVADWWNALMVKAAGSGARAPAGSEAHAALQASMFTNDDVKWCIAALSRVLNRQPEDSVKQADLFFTNFPSNPEEPVEATEAKWAVLKQPVYTINSREVLNDRLALLEQKQSERQAISPSQSAQKAQPLPPTQLTRNNSDIETHRPKFNNLEPDLELGDPFYYKWENPKDAEISFAPSHTRVSSRNRVDPNATKYDHCDHNKRKFSANTPIPSGNSARKGGGKGSGKGGQRKVWKSQRER